MSRRIADTLLLAHGLFLPLLMGLREQSGTDWLHLIPSSSLINMLFSFASTGTADFAQALIKQ